MKKIFVMMIMFSGCSGGDPNNGTMGDPLKYNALKCVSSDSTYLVHSNQRSGGTCGLMSDSIFITNKDGTISRSSTDPVVTCEDEWQDGCENKKINCQYTIDNCTVKFSSNIKYLSNGSSGEGIITFTIKCSDGNSCMSVYNVYYTRQ
jgi:hypothetical protein